MKYITHWFCYKINKFFLKHRWINKQIPSDNVVLYDIHVCCDAPTLYKFYTLVLNEDFSLSLFLSQALYNRLVPSVNGVRRFSAIQLGRLRVSPQSCLTLHVPNLDRYPHLCGFFCFSLPFSCTLLFALILYFSVLEQWPVRTWQFRVSLFFTYFFCSFTEIQMEI